MSDQPFYAPNRKIPPPQPRIGEPLWTIQKDGRLLACELRDDGEAGVEVQMSRDGEFLYGRQFERARWRSRKPPRGRFNISARAASSSEQRRIMARDATGEAPASGVVMLSDPHCFAATETR
jgi:hypothetical protein